MIDFYSLSENFQIHFDNCFIIFWNQKLLAKNLFFQFRNFYLIFSRQAKELGEKMLKIEAKLNVLISTLSTPHDIFKILRAFEIQNLKIRTVIFEIYWTRFPTVWKSQNRKNFRKLFFSL